MRLVALLVWPRASLIDVVGLQLRGDLVIDELAAAIRIEDRQSEWKPLLQVLDVLQDPRRHVVADREFSVHPVTRSVIVSMRANSPISAGPQGATVSARHPRVSGASPA